MSFLHNLFRPKLQPMNIINIHKSHILHNMGYIQSFHPHAALFPVLKSNAYGHGLEQMTKILESYPTPYLVVDSLPEYFLAKKFTKKKFLLLEETLAVNYKQIDLNHVTFAVYNQTTLEQLLKLNKPCTVHLFLNTGMNREGIDEDDLKNILEYLKHHDTKAHIHIEGVMSHFAEADTSNESVQQQIHRFKHMHQIILEYGHSVIYRHIGNSAGTLTINDEFFNAWRPGLALYGYNPLDPSHPQYENGQRLKPALDVFSTIISTHKVTEGQGVSYNFQRMATHDTTVGVLPFGYYEGLPRAASGNISFVYHKKTYGQIGTICMNLCTFDLGNTEAHIGDRVQLISCQPNTSNTIAKLAQASGMIVREILVNLDKGIRKEIV